MRDLRNIYKRGGARLMQELKRELRAQGHHNTGALEASFASNVTVSGDEVQLTGRAIDYAGILSDGTRPEKASMKQFHFVKEFFLSKGVEPKKAGAYAAMTIRKWMREGMSTRASVRFSKNGRRLNFIGFVREKKMDAVNRLVLKDIDIEVQRVFNKTKSKTI